MKPLRVSEVYLSIQGEGPRVGQPTIFVRFAGCNLRCPGWPCDTPHAIFPELYRNEWKSVDVTELLEAIQSKAEGRRLNICFTGGEPFLQNHEAFKDLVERLFEDYTLEVFSNGTIEYPDWAFEYLYFIMDWKLPSSGEDLANHMRIAVNLPRLQADDAIKFVCADRNDYDQAVNLWEEHIKIVKPELIVFIGVVWNRLEPKELVTWMLEDKLPWRLNLQTHNLIWPVNERAR